MPHQSEDGLEVDLGNISVSLSVSDIAASRAFYEKFGFEILGGNQDENWLILQYGQAVIGLFQGMFEENLLTFNPPDVRAIQQSLKAEGVTFQLEADETTAGPAHAALADPDGIQILLDQFQE